MLAVTAEMAADSSKPGGRDGGSSTSATCSARCRTRPRDRRAFVALGGCSRRARTHGGRTSRTASSRPSPAHRCRACPTVGAVRAGGPRPGARRRRAPPPTASSRSSRRAGPDICWRSWRARDPRGGRRRGEHAARRGPALLVDGSLGVVTLTPATTVARAGAMSPPRDRLAALPGRDRRRPARRAARQSRSRRALRRQPPRVPGRGTAADRTRFHSGGPAAPDRRAGRRLPAEVLAASPGRGRSSCAVLDAEPDKPLPFVTA